MLLAFFLACSTNGTTPQSQRDVRSHTNFGIPVPIHLKPRSRELRVPPARGQPPSPPAYVPGETQHSTLNEHVYKSVGFLDYTYPRTVPVVGIPTQSRRNSLLKEIPTRSRKCDQRAVKNVLSYSNSSVKNVAGFLHEVWQAVLAGCRRRSRRSSRR